MATATLTIPDEVKAELKQFSWVNWSEVVKEELIEKSERDEKFKRFDKLLKDSRLTDELVFRLADELKKKVAKRHGL